jgi:[ribosomal protein S5]-alanine N-acetyltransferase
MDSLVKYANNPKIAANLTNRFVYPYKWENGVAFIEMAMSEAPPFLLCMGVEGEAIGGIGLHAQ